jgi:hypothetical protein
MAPHRAGRPAHKRLRLTPATRVFRRGPQLPSSLPFLPELAAHACDCSLARPFVVDTLNPSTT